MITQPFPIEKATKEEVVSRTSLLGSQNPFLEAGFNPCTPFFQSLPVMAAMERGISTPKKSHPSFQKWKAAMNFTI